jgi:NAD(P)-dependent dehydrogenase (short-subunit alcohol dehydrogenase family)
MRQFEGKTAIVTGAASGIGLGLARTFARYGMSVSLCDMRGARLDAALAELRALGVRAIACDMRGARLDAALAELRALGARAIAVVTDLSDLARHRRILDAFDDCKRWSAEGVASSAIGPGAAPR